MRWIGTWVPAAALVMLTTACELPETPIAGGRSVLVVHAVMRPDLGTQFVVVERSQDGVTEPLLPEQGVIPPSLPQIPVTDAVVTVENLNGPGGPCGAAVRFVPWSADGGVYWAPAGCLVMRPGDRLALRVETDEGEIVTGVTRLPGMSAAAVAVGGDSVALPDTAAPWLNRDRDTLRVSVSPLAGRLMQVELRRYEDRSDWGTIIFADTTAVRLPGDLVDVFESNLGTRVFLAGRSYALTIGIADTNYFDFTRSANNEILGRGFINHLEGGVGLFGSLVATTTRLWVTGDQDDPREGTYRMQGTLEGIPIDVTMTAYLANDLQTDALSAFAHGQWVRGGPIGPEGAWRWVPEALEGLSVDGTFDGEALAITVPTLVGSRPQVDMRPWQIRGVRTAGAAFTAAVVDSTAFGAVNVGTLTITQQ